MTDQNAVEEELRARIAELEERVRLLTGDPASFRRLRPHGFNPRQAKLLITLARAAPDVVSTAGLIVLDQSSAAGIKVLVCKTRKLLKPEHGAIETIHGGGYRASKTLADWVTSVTVDAETTHPQEELPPCPSQEVDRPSQPEGPTGAASLP
ncbi:helix-like DNA-binding protein [Brevundimonas phage vB_BpoS-Polewnik]|nr:helix-like DNA-binding protein [Brevundimonas phage vB_BpoS-Polewnik]